MVKIQIDEIIYNVRPGNNLLHTCLALGFDLPYFCYHPALGSVGACRQCAVKKFSNADDKRGKIIMSCMEPVTDGLIISINDPEAKAFRASIIESLMTNHPHDCPVCDEGGECHLQDMTVMTGHNYRRFAFKKRTYVNQDLGPYIQHEMNRCIQCYRCVRFYGDYAGGRDLVVSGSANRVYFGRHKDGRLESEFSGNLVEVCPTGVFTDKTLKNHYTRKWDMTNSPSICINCSLGCNIIVSERYGSVRRIMSRYNGSVNGYFICDRGRFGYEYLNSPGRIKNIRVRRSRQEKTDNISGETFQSLLRSALEGKKTAGIGSPAASLESNYALEMLVGKENFYQGVPADEFELVKTAVRILKYHPAHSPSLKQIERSDAVLILGEDISGSAPIMDLAVRQASRNLSIKNAARSGIPSWNDTAVREFAQESRSPVFIATPEETKIDDLAEATYRASANEIAKLGFAVAYRIDDTAPYPGISDNPLDDTIRKIADSLIQADNPLIITGLQSHNMKLLFAASNIALALLRKGKQPLLSFVFPESNSLGLGLMDGLSINDLIEEANKGEKDTLIILENDLYKRFGKEKTDLLLSKFRNIIVLGYMDNESTERADILIPSGTFAESTGTIVNNEGRAQRYYRVLPAVGEVRDSWKYLLEMIGITGTIKTWTGIKDQKNPLPERFPEKFDDIAGLLTDAYPFFSKIKEIMPDSGYKIHNEKIGRQTLRFSGRTAMKANTGVSEPAPLPDEDSPLAFTMEGHKGVAPSALIPYYWSPGWNSVQAVNKYMDEPDGKIKDDQKEVLLFSEKKGDGIDFFGWQESKTK
jgi:NADH-quinone oxidoreductase subunit G